MDEQQLELFDPNTITADQVLDNLPSDLLDDSRTWPSLLAEMVDILADKFEERWGLDQETATARASDVAVFISHYFGGRSFYLPRDDRLKRAIRDISIYRAFNGSNHLELARKTGLTTTQIYNIVKKQRQLRFEKSNPPLPFTK